MCICAYDEKQKFFKKYKNLSRGCATLPNVPKLGVSASRIPQKLTKIEACHVTYRRHLILRRSLESRTPLEEFLIFLKLFSF